MPDGTFPGMFQRAPLKKFGKERQNLEHGRMNFHFILPFVTFPQSNQICYDKLKVSFLVQEATLAACHCTLASTALFNSAPHCLNKL